jgi:hypothetical protein
VGWRGRYVAYSKNMPKDDERRKKTGPIVARYKHLQGEKIPD